MTYTIEDLRTAVGLSSSYSETLSRLGKSKTGGAYELLQRKIRQHNIDVNHFGVNKRKYCFNKKHWSLVLVNNPTLLNRMCTHKLRRALLEYGREYKCEDCPNTGTWNGKDIVLEIDHIDGDWHNNDKENLRFLCPNCHSQTKTYYNQKQQSYCKCGNTKFRTSKSCLDCGRKKRRKITDRPSKEQLIQDFIELKYYVRVANKYGVSDKAIVKWVKAYDFNPKMPD